MSVGSTQSRVRASTSRPARLLTGLHSSRGHIWCVRSMSWIITTYTGTKIENTPDIAITSNEHFAKLACDPVGSHLLERLVAQAPEGVFRSMWRCCFSLELETLILDPLANFVVATALGRIDEEEMEDIFRAPKSVWSKCVGKTSNGVQEPR